MFDIFWGGQYAAGVSYCLIEGLDCVQPIIQPVLCLVKKLLPFFQLLLCFVQLCQARIELGRCYAELLCQFLKLRPRLIHTGYVFCCLGFSFRNLFLRLAELFPGFVNLPLPVEDGLLQAAANFGGPAGCALISEVFQCVGHGFYAALVFFTVAVFRCAIDADARFHKGAAKPLAVEAALCHIDIRRHRNHIAEVIRGMEDTRNHKVMLQKRISFQNGVAVDVKSLADSKPAVVRQLFLNGAFFCRFGQTTFQHHRHRNALRHADNRDDGVAVSGMQAGIDQPDRFGFPDARNGPDRLQVFLGHQHGGNSFCIPELLRIEKVHRIFFQCRGRIGDAEIGH